MKLRLHCFFKISDAAAWPPWTTGASRAPSSAADLDAIKSSYLREGRAKLAASLADGRGTLGGVRWLILLLCGLLPMRSFADDARAAQWRAVYEQGREAFEAHNFELAYERFRDLYMSSQRPALLFNMASALKELRRPHEAAERLRAYLRVVPDSPDRRDIEQRILTLEEAQHILDAERPLPPVVVVKPQPPPPLQLQVMTPTPSRPRRWPVWVGVGGGVAVALGLGLGLGLGLQPTAASPTVSTLGTIRGTP